MKQENMRCIHRRKESQDVEGSVIGMYMQWLVTFTSDAQHSSSHPVAKASKSPLFFISVNRLRLFYNVSVMLGGTCIIITYSASSFALQPKSRVCNVTGLCHTSLSGVHWNVTSTLSEGLPIRSPGVHAQTRWTQGPQEARFLITASKIASQALLSFWGYTLIHSVEACRAHHVITLVITSSTIIITVESFRMWQEEKNAFVVQPGAKVIRKKRESDTFADTILTKRNSHNHMILWKLCACVWESMKVHIHMNVCICTRMSACVYMCAMSMETSVCVCDRGMIHSVTTVRRNDWTSWAETTAAEAAFSYDIQPNTLTKSHLTGPSYRKWKRKPLVHPVLHPNLCSALHVKPLL